jgi:tRNA(Ile)-lysidine synthetase-like protein
VTLPAPGFPLWLRPPQPGDRLRLSAGHRKLSDVMIDAKIPRSERVHQLVLGFGEEPLWLLGIQSAATRFEPPDSAITLVVERCESDETSPL